MVAGNGPETTMVRPRDLGEAHVIGEAGMAIAVRASVLVGAGDEGPAWGGQLRPYRPLTLTPGRYLLRVCGEDLGAIRVRAVRNSPDRELADFLGEGTPGAALRHLLTAGAAPVAARPPSFPRVAGAVEPTLVGRFLFTVGAALWLIVRVPKRLLARRRRVGM